MAQLSTNFVPISATSGITQAPTWNVQGQATNDLLYVSQQTGLEYVTVGSATQYTSSGFGASIFNVTGNAYITGNMTANSTSSISDRTFKKNIESFDAHDALDAVQKLRPVKYDWRVDEFPERKLNPEKDIGFIAQEVKEILPYVVKGAADGEYSVDYARIVTVLVGAVQDLTKQVEDLKAKLA
jgi:hypothetical protein